METSNFTKFANVLGESGMEKAADLEAASVETTTTNLFENNPRMSYPPKAWIDKDPTFWKVFAQP